MNGVVQKQSGQVVIVLAIIIPFIILQLAFLVNISLLVHQKVRLQNAVDAGAYSAAASMARDLNRIADLNFNIDQMWHGDDPSNPALFNSSWEQSFDQYIDDTSYNGEEMARALHNRYVNDYVAINEEMEYVSKTAFARAIGLGDEALRLTYYNGHEALAEANPSNVTFDSRYDSSMQGRGFMDYAEHTVGRSISYVISSGGCSAAWDACAGYSSIGVEINTPISKLNKIAFVGKAQADPGFSPLASARYLVAPWRLTAYAKAQPYGGSIEGLAGTYGAALVPLGEVDGKTFYH